MAISRQAVAFLETGGGESAPSLASRRLKEPYADKDQLVGYLKDGIVWGASPGVVEDAFSDSHEIAGTTSIRTDDVWWWRDDVAYYVKKYDIELPTDFVNWVRSQEYQLPRLEDVDLSPPTF